MRCWQINMILYAFKHPALFITNYRKISITGPYSNRGPFHSLDAKNAFFQANFQKKMFLLFEARFFWKLAWNIEIKMNIEKKKPVLHYAEASRIYISSEFLAVGLQQNVPLNKVHCFWHYFHFVRKYLPSLASCEPCTVLCPGQCIFKVLSIPSMEITVYCVNSLLPTDFATLASQDSNPYR